jgi:DNA-binding CsgD family transcriptional regulator
MTKIEKIILLLCLIIITGYNCFEIIEELIDYTKLDNDPNFEFELLIVFISLAATVYVTYLIIRQDKNQVELELHLSKVKKQLEGSNIRLREGKKEYQEVIKWQFKEWSLSPSEQEVALLILKGLSIKEISNARSTKEKTVRTQASAIYEKSKLSGRHELSAWFFEDLL